MKLSTFKEHLQHVTILQFKILNGEQIPSHFHITEVGKQTNHFIDCGGTIRQDQKVKFQLWAATDVDHRLKPQKLLGIIRLSERKLEIPEYLEIFVEYQGTTIETYGLEFDNGNFILTPIFTDCLAKDNCGIPEVKEIVTACKPGGGCC